MKKLTHLDCFSGIAGFSLGFEATGGIETIAFCENNPHRVDNIKNIWPKAVIHSDIQRFPIEQYKGKVDIISGGSPCQDISVAGFKRLSKILKGEICEREEDKRSSLWEEYLKIAAGVEARWIVLENVANLCNIGLAAILKTLNEYGYNAQWTIISGRACGAPHLRRRLLLTAWKASNTDLQRFWPSFATEKEGWIWWTKTTASIRPWWLSEPNVGRVVHGVHKKLDKVRKERVAALGNAIIPQIAFILGRQLLKNENFTDETLEEFYTSENPFFPWPRTTALEMKKFIDN